MYEVSVIIPNYNGKHYLKDCLEAILSQEFSSFEVLVVDNGSKDGSAAYVKEKYPQVKLVELEENTGFCGAVNKGIQNSKARYVLLLNNDTKAEPGFMKELVKGMERSPDIFSCQAKMLQMQDQTKIDDAGNYYCALGWAFADGKGKPEAGYSEERRIFSCCAGAAIYRREVLEKIGSFDEEHFAYLEDLDVGYRARLYGYQNWYCPKARVLHVGSGTSGSRYNQFKIRYSSRNNVYMIYKNMPVWQIVLNFPLLLIGFGSKAVFFGLKGYGKEYLAGVKNGFDISRKNRDRKVRFTKKNRSECFEIQKELWKNIGKRLGGK